MTRRLREATLTTTYVAKDVRLRLWHAVTLLSAEVADDDLSRAFEASAKSRAEVTHRNLLPIVEIDAHRGQPFVVWELALGGTIAEWLRRFGAMPPWLAIDVVLQACRAVAHARTRGFTHRGIEPADLLVTEDGRVVVGELLPIDGPSAVADDERDQVFALGATLFTCVTGLAREALRKLGSLEGVPRRLAQVVQDACLKSPDMRIATVAQLSLRLEECVDSVAHDVDAPSLNANPFEVDERAIYSVLPERLDELAALLNPSDVAKAKGVDEETEAVEDAPTAPAGSSPRLPTLDELLDGKVSPMPSSSGEPPLTDSFGSREATEPADTPRPRPVAPPSSESPSIAARRSESHPRGGGRSEQGPTPDPEPRRWTYQVDTETARPTDVSSESKPQSPTVHGIPPVVQIGIPVILLLSLLAALVSLL